MSDKNPSEFKYFPGNIPNGPIVHVPVAFPSPEPEKLAEGADVYPIPKSFILTVLICPNEIV